MPAGHAPQATSAHEAPSGLHHARAVNDPADNGENDGYGKRDCDEFGSSPAFIDIVGEMNVMIHERGSSLLTQ